MFKKYIIANRHTGHALSPVFNSLRAAQDYLDNNLAHFHTLLEILTLERQEKLYQEFLIRQGWIKK